MRETHNVLTEIDSQLYIETETCDSLCGRHIDNDLTEIDSQLFLETETCDSLCGREGKRVGFGLKDFE